MPTQDFCCSSGRSVGWGHHMPARYEAIDHSFVPELSEAIETRDDKYFFILTHYHWSIYQRQINTRNKTYKLLPIELAAKKGRTEVVRKLLLNGANVEGPAALKVVLENINATSPEIITDLLAYGANTKGLLIRGQTPLLYLRDKFSKEQANPLLGLRLPVTNEVITITNEVITILEGHELWLSRQDWCGAVVRAGLYTRAIAKKGNDPLK